MPRKSKLELEAEEAMKKLARATQKHAGADEPGQAGRRARARIAERAKGEISVEDYVRRQKADEKKRKT
jgi:hypothetical protein